VRVCAQVSISIYIYVFNYKYADNKCTHKRMYLCPHKHTCEVIRYTVHIRIHTRTYAYMHISTCIYCMLNVCLDTYIYCKYIYMKNSVWAGVWEQSERERERERERVRERAIERERESEEGEIARAVVLSDVKLEPSRGHVSSVSPGCRL